MEDNAARPEPDELNEEPINAAEKLKQLEEEADRLREQLKAEDDDKKAEEPESRVQVREETSQTSSPEQVAEAEGLVRQARLAKSRNESAKSLDLLRQAEQIAPDSVMVLLELGDGFAAKNRWKDAQAVYGRATKLDPSNIVVERKYAEAVLKASIPLEVLLSGRQSHSDEVMANANSAALISVFLPGVGQIVLGQVTKGIIYLAVWVCMLIIGFLLLNNGGDKTLAQYAFGPLLFAVMLNIVAFYDAKSLGKADSKKPISRPKPPVDLPFE